MTENYPPPVPAQMGNPPVPDARADQNTADVVKDQAADVGHSSVEAGKHAAEVARDEASGVVTEARRQGRNLLRQAQDQMLEQAARGQQRVAGELISLGDELRSMADRADRDGPAGDLARTTASRAHSAGQWLDSREPRQVLDEVQAFARRKPGLFLAMAAGVGLVAGRLTRGMQAAASDGSSAAPAAPEPGEIPTPSAVPSYPVPGGPVAADRPRPAGTP
jgi:hypothetical protein